MAHNGKTNLADALTAEIKADSEFLPRQPVDDEADRDRKLAEGWLQAETNALSVRPTSVVAVHYWPRQLVRRGVRSRRWGR